MVKGFVHLSALLAVVAMAAFTADLSKATKPAATQPVIETVITQVRGCDIIQYIQGDVLVTAFAAPDQPETCKIPVKIANNQLKRGGK